MDSLFDPNQQEQQVDYKIVAALERLSQAFRTLMWSRGKHLGLSPIQMQCLVFIRYHDNSKNRIGHLAREFDVTPATVSEAVRILVSKGFVEKQASAQDARVQHLVLTAEGIAVLEKIGDWANVLSEPLGQMPQNRKQETLILLFDLIKAFQEKGLITVARQCTTCRFFRADDASGPNAVHYCKLLEKDLPVSALRVDCPEHELIS